ncbi:MAG TPA: transglycosylase SLT domain-containing protein [Homoserinimonas sp.]|nr:transglycosylase SLT domain-containing protein [Homoserinimonas sp.]
MARDERRPFVLRTFAFTVAAAVMLVFAIAPMDRESALAETAHAEAEAAADAGPAQSLAVAGDHSTAVLREGYVITKPKPKPKPVVTVGRSAPAAGVPDPGTAKAIAYSMVTARGWGEGEYNCLVALWQKESGWNVYANNPSSGAYGIPQALPGSKMATAGADWATNPATQITWGLGYIQGRYGTPCGAWNASQAKGWY